MSTKHVSVAAIGDGVDSWSARIGAVHVEFGAGRRELLIDNADLDIRVHRLPESVKNAFYSGRAPDSPRRASAAERIRQPTRHPDVRQTV